MSKREPLRNIHLKYIDDLSVAQAINLKECLVTNPNPNPTLPLSYHDRTNHILPAESYQLQDQLNQLVKYSEDNQMVINVEKCKVMIYYSTCTLVSLLCRCGIDDLSLYLHFVI